MFNNSWFLNHSLNPKSLLIATLCPFHMFFDPIDLFNLCLENRSINRGRSIIR